MQEIERKFLIVGDFKQEATHAITIKQAYLNSNPNRSVRVRIKGEKAYLTIKGASNKTGISRFEWEKEISIEEANQLFLLCEDGCINKRRYIVPEGKHFFEIDEFYGDNKGLLLAEIELESEEEEFIRPSWLGKEVTGDKRYYNSALMNNPYCKWKNQE